MRVPYQVNVNGRCKLIFWVKKLEVQVASQDLENNDMLIP